MRKPLKLKIAAYVVAGLIVISPPLYLWVAEIDSARRYESALKTLSGMGYPLTLPEFNKLAPPDAAKSNRIYADLIEKYKKHIDKGSGAAPNGSKHPNAETVALLEKNKELIDDFESVTAFQRVWPDRNYEDGLDLRLPDMTSKIGMIKILGAQARRDAHLGNLASATKRLQTMGSIARHLQTDPVNVCWFAGFRGCRERDIAAIGVASECRTREEREAVKKVLLDDPLYADPDIPFSWEVLEVQHLPDEHTAYYFENRLPKQVFIWGPVANRWRALRAEHLVRHVKVSRGGYSKPDHHLLYEAERADASSWNPLTRIAFQELRPVWPMGLNTVPESRRLTMALVDTLIEEAGGPKAILPSGISRLRVGPGNWKLEGSERMLSLIAGEVKMGPK